MWPHTPYVAGLVMKPKLLSYKELEYAKSTNIAIVCGQIVSALALLWGTEIAG